MNLYKSFLLMSWSIEQQSVLWGWPSQWPTASWEPVSQRVSMAQKCTKVPTQFSGSILILSQSHNHHTWFRKDILGQAELKPCFLCERWYNSGTTYHYNTIQNAREPTKDLQSKELTTAISPLFCASSSAIPNQLETPGHFWPIAHPKRKNYPLFSFPRDCQCIAVEICNSPESSTLVF